ncbi:MAG: biotin--[acetyl-CoA-carboxylase] ligase [Clostridiales bacterium]|nr:biotin--[acetyl-CoA-carboxylase] ligase [Clostridiales bacterium]MBR0468130.1 biotin--[acetyl-CoA-carboxylase] ligase [Mogibacterium sp.]
MGTKDTVLALFERNRGFYVSGEKIASELNITRTAVWKAVKILQHEGYDIKAVTNRGYCLDKGADVLSIRGIRGFLGEDMAGLRPEVFVSVDSTNNVCREKAGLGESEGYVAIAGAQTAGRGRRGRSFFSPAETGIYMSVLLKPETMSEDMLAKISEAALEAARSSIEELSGRQASVRGDNDIMIDGKKVGGVMYEMWPEESDRDPEYVIAGTGINAYEPENGFPPEIAAQAGSVFSKQEVGLKNHLTAELLRRFMTAYKEL